MKKVIFLDRDGTINVEKNYLHKWNEFEFEDKAILGLKELKKMGYEFIIVTNQSGIARGYYTEDDLEKLHTEMSNYLKNEGIEILDIYYCPHHQDGIGEYRKKCDCRKPESKMLERAIEKYDIDIKKSFMIGDKKSDLEVGDRVGVTSILVLTGYGEKTKQDLTKSYLMGKNLLEIAEIIKKYQ